MSHSPSIHDVVDSRPLKRMRFPHREDDEVVLDSKSKSEGARSRSGIFVDRYQ